MWIAFVGMLVTGALVGAAQAWWLRRTRRLGRIESDEYRFERNGDRLMRIVLNRRARLGIKVNLQARETDSIGAYVDAVTPGRTGRRRPGSGRATSSPSSTASRCSPAAAAARRERAPVAPRAQAHRAGGQARAQRHRAARVPPGQGQADRFGRDRRRPRHVRCEGPGGRPFRAGVPRPGLRGTGFSLPATGWNGTICRASRAFFSDGPLGDLELAPLNPDLGQYFGATEGVLVISVARTARSASRAGTSCSRWTAGSRRAPAT